MFNWCKGRGCLDLGQLKRLWVIGCRMGLFVSLCACFSVGFEVGLLGVNGGYMVVVFLIEGKDSENER